MYLGIVLSFVVFVTGAFSYSQSSKAAALMDDFKNMIPKTCSVKRDGEFRDMEAAGLVPGDIVQLGGGD